MIVFLTGSSWQLKEDLPFLRYVTKVIEKNGGVLASDWVEPSFKRADDSSQRETQINWGGVVDRAIKAISHSDVVIVEATSYRFSQGYQVAIALQMKKPVLVISRLSNEGRSILGIRNKLFRLVEYKSKQDLDSVIATFMQDNTITTKDLRFNFFIDRQIYNYLRSVSYETGKNKSEIIRDLIEREIKRNSDHR